MNSSLSIVHSLFTLMRRRRKRKDGDIARPLDRDRHLPLVLCTVSRDPSGNDLSPFRNKISKNLWILVIDIQFFVRTESADLSPHEGFPLPVATWSFHWFSHSVLLISLGGVPRFFLRSSGGRRR